MANNINNRKPEVSASEADKVREAKSPFEWAPGKHLIASLRSYQRYQYSKNPLFAFFKKWAVVRHRFWSIITGADIPINCKIDLGLLIPHPNGIVIHPDAKIGPNCLIFQQVTIGMRNGGVPSIGGHVDIGAGAKILGPITIGDDVVIGANSVVLSNVEAGSTVVGIPARLVLKSTGLTN